MIAKSMAEGLASLDDSVKLIIELPVEQLQNVSSLLPFSEKRKGIQKVNKDNMSVEEIDELLWPESFRAAIGPEIWEPMSQFTDFWWVSMGSKDLRPEYKSGTPNSCEEYID